MIPLSVVTTILMEAQFRSPTQNETVKMFVHYFTNSVVVALLASERERELHVTQHLPT